jgi:glycine betaine/proline transport system substrate-binding protein
MYTMKGIAFGLASLTFGALALPATAQAADCGTAKSITIAEMTWLSASSLAHVAQRILSTGYGCDAQLVPGDTVPTATSMMTRGQPNVAPELWVSTVQAIWDQAKEKGTMYKAGDIFSGGGQEGWWVPDYVMKDNPQIKTMADLKANWKVFAEAANPGKGRLYGCPPGWGCEIITNNLFKALKLGETYELFSPGSGENLKASIARAVAQKQPFVGYYWGPSDVIAKYGLVRLGMSPFDAAKFKCLTDVKCENPQDSGWAVGEVAVAATPDIKASAPDVATFLAKMQIPNDKINDVLVWGDKNKATPKDIAVYFLKEHRAIWSTWVPADVAERITKAL